MFRLDQKYSSPHQEKVIQTFEVFLSCLLFLSQFWPTLKNASTCQTLSGNLLLTRLAHFSLPAYSIQKKKKEEEPTFFSTKDVNKSASVQMWFDSANKITFNIVIWNKYFFLILKLFFFQNKMIYFIIALKKFLDFKHYLKTNLYLLFEKSWKVILFTVSNHICFTPKPGAQFRGYLYHMKNIDSKIIF